MKELIDALTVIKRECTSHDTCRTCPMGSLKGDCLVACYAPENWRIIKPKPVARVIEEVTYGG